MNAIQFIKEHGVDKAREVVEGAPFNSTCYVFWTGKFRYINELTCEIYSEKLGGWCEANIMVLNLKNPLSELKRLVESVDLINSVGGLTIANKITFQKRLRNEKATHFIQHPENQKLIQLFGRNQRKPEAAIKFDLFEQAIADYESIYGGEHV